MLDKRADIRASAKTKNKRSRLKKERQIQHELQQQQQLGDGPPSDTVMNVGEHQISNENPPLADSSEAMHPPSSTGFTGAAAVMGTLPSDVVDDCHVWVHVD